jgi:hypothetical protein
MSFAAKMAQFGALSGPKQPPIGPLESLKMPLNGVFVALSLPIIAR